MEWWSNGVMSLLVHYSNTPLLQHPTSRLLDEQFPGAAASVTIVRQIRLGLAGVRRYQGAHPLDSLEIQIRDPTTLEPEVDRPALQGARLLLKVFQLQL